MQMMLLSLIMATILMLGDIVGCQTVSTGKCKKTFDGTEVSVTADGSHSFSVPLCRDPLFYEKICQSKVGGFE